MANLKITQLPPSTTPLTGSEIVPVVQSGATVQTSVNSLGPGIGYTPAGTGAVARTVQAKLRESVSVKDFGAVGDEVADDTAAIQAAINSINLTNGGSIYFPAGRYKVTSQLNITTSNLTLHGDGQRSSSIRIYHDTGYGILVQASVSPGTNPLFNFSMFDMTVRARVETTANAGIYLNNVLSCIFDNVSVEDHFGGLLIGGGNEHYYSNFAISSARSIYWPAVKVGSFFLKINQSSTGDLPYNIYFVNFNFQRNDTVSLVNNGVVINCADGVWFSNGHIQGVVGANLWLNCIDSTKQISGIFCNNVWFDSDSVYGVRVTGTSSVVFQQIELTGCNFLRPTINGVLFDAGSNCQGIQISGGWMIESGSYGILLNSGTRTIINGMFFGACNGDGAANTSAINIQTGVDNVTIQGCEFNQTANSSTTAPLMQGIRIANTASENIFVTGNAFRLDPAMPDIVDLSTLDNNAYPNNVTTKALTVTPAAGSLPLPEIGNQFYVAAGNFSNCTGRWDNRVVVLVFAGVSVVTSAAGIRLAGSVNFTSKAGDTLTLLYSPDLASWIETSRMVS
jgi:hypothetical protein